MWITPHRAPPSSLPLLQFPRSDFTSALAREQPTAVQALPSRKALSLKNSLRATTVVGLTSALATVALVAAPAQAADAPITMNRMQMEQAVLRAQPAPVGNVWEQNFYLDNKSSASDPAMLIPYLCPAQNGKPITLPKADSYGSVGYSDKNNNTARITIWQYKTAAQAKAAADTFTSISCPDTPKVDTEAGMIQTTGGGGDFGTTKVDGQYAYLKGYELTMEGLETVVLSGVRPVGNTIVRVETELIGKQISQKTYTQAATMVSKWVDRASRAVMKYSGMDPHAA